MIHFDPYWMPVALFLMLAFAFALLARYAAHVQKTGAEEDKPELRHLWFVMQALALGFALLGGTGAVLLILLR